MKKHIKIYEFTFTQLMEWFNAFVETQSKTSKVRILTAFALMMELFENARPRPDGTRVEHILRVTLMTILLGGDDADSVVKALLHDSVEEADEILAHKCFAGYFKGFIPPHKDTFQFFAHEHIHNTFGKRAGVVHLTIPRHKELKERHLLYIQHVKKLLNGKHQKDAIVKLGDFYDNGLKLFMIADIQFRKNMCERYLPLYPLFTEAINTGKLKLYPDIKAAVLRDIKEAKKYTESQLGIAA